MGRDPPAGKKTSSCGFRGGDGPRRRRLFSVVCGRRGGRGEELPTHYTSKAPATSRWEKSPLGLFVSREPGRLRLWKLGKITKLAVGAGLGSSTTRTRPRPSRLCPLSGTLWVTGLGRARIGPAALPWGAGPGPRGPAKIPACLDLEACSKPRTPPAAAEMPAPTSHPELPLSPSP